MKLSISHFRVVLFSVLVLIGILAGAEQVAVATKVSGSVNHAQGKKSALLKPGMILNDGDKIRTGSNGFVALIFIDDKSTLKIKNDTELEITGKREQNSIAKKINMDRGTIRATVTKRTKTDFVVQTPTSVASVKGTDFWMISDPIQGDQLIGIEGVVSFTNIISGMTLDITNGLTGKSTTDGGLNSDITNPDIIPKDPDDEDTGKGRSELRIRFLGPDDSIKTLIIEYQ